METSRPSFPSFRLTFSHDKTLSELSVIKDINRLSEISLRYGRYSSSGQMINKSISSRKIYSLDLITDFSSKVSCYSIVAMGIDKRWNSTQFEKDLRKKYPSVVKIERLYVKVGIPISKVRIEFSLSQ